MLGAGSSVPFGIPGMRRFVLDFKTSLKRKPALNEFLGQIESALENSEKLIGSEIPFDLESLIVVLQDLVATEDKPISAPTFALMLHLIIQKRLEVGEYTITDARQTFGERAKALLDRLRNFIFSCCIRPLTSHVRARIDDNIHAMQLLLRRSVGNQENQAKSKL